MWWTSLLKMLTWAPCTGTPRPLIRLRVINFEAMEGVARFMAVGASTLYYGLQYLNMKMIPKSV